MAVMDKATCFLSFPSSLRGGELNARNASEREGVATCTSLAPRPPPRLRGARGRGKHVVPRRPLQRRIDRFVVFLLETRNQLGNVDHLRHAADALAAAPYF